MFRSTLMTAFLIASTPALAQPAAQESMSRAKLLANAEAEFAKVDANKDGQMTRAEIETFQLAKVTEITSARSKAVFTALDTDKNGQLSAAEFAKLTPAPKVDATNVLRIDTNKDGQVSLAEHKAATLETFNKVDSNKDGMLTATEVKAALEKK